MSEAEPAPDIKPSAPAAGPQQVSEAEPTASQQQSPLDAATLSGPTEVKLESINAPAPEVKIPQAPVPEPTAPTTTTTTIKEEPPAAERASADISGGNPSAPQLTPPNTNHTYAPPQPNRQSNGSIQNASSGLAPPLTTNTANPTSMQSMVNQTQPIYAPPQTTQAPIGSPLPSGMPPMGAYMHPYPGMQMGSPQMRYQLPGDHSKMLSGSRHKKEVKRRTKTGCLTCRKRRIKCDEGHPVCRNCVKSKRECLGYDPVFRPQPTPSTIQPAPNSSPSLVVNPQDPSSYPPAPPGYVAASAQPYAPPSVSDSSTPPIDQPNYGAPIENSFDPNVSASAMETDQNTIDGNTQSGDGAASTAAPASSEPPTLKAKQVKIQDLLALRGISPPPPHPIVPIQQTRLDEIQAVYLTTYAPAIDLFLETRWFQDKGLSQLLTNAQLMAQFSGLIDAFHDPKLSEAAVQNKLESFEASVVWDMMSICRSAAHLVNGNAGSMQEFDLLIAVKRLEVFEALLTGEHLEVNPLSQTPVRQPAADPPSKLADQLQQRALDFWDAIGHFLTLYDNEASSAKELDDTLVRARALLDTRENRDVIYSVAIARHIGQRWADFPRTVPQVTTADEKDAGAKLYVAQKFLEEEASGKGTNQVIRRLCGMVVRSWTVSRQ